LYFLFSINISSNIIFLIFSLEGSRNEIFVNAFYLFVASTQDDVIMFAICIGL